MEALCKNEMFGHNFPYTGAKCMNCGISQDELSGKVKKPAAILSGLSSLVNGMSQRIQAPPPAKKSSLHTQMHWLVNELRKSFGETATKGKGSFGFYLGCLTKLGFESSYAIWQELEKSDVGSKQRLFWWKYGKLMKERKEKKAALSKL